MSLSCSFFGYRQGEPAARSFLVSFVSHQHSLDLVSGPYSIDPLPRHSAGDRQSDLGNVLHCARVLVSGGARRAASVQQEIVRAPLLGASPYLLSWCFSFAFAVVGIAATSWLYRVAYARIAYWI